jgi:hypothetical protein
MSGTRCSADFERLPSVPRGSNIGRLARSTYLHPAPGALSPESNGRIDQELGDAGRNGRPPIGVQRMLRIYFLQQ